MQPNRQSGFSLIELAVVLVIIGIILGAILKGQDLINSSKVKKVQSDMSSIETMLWSYYDRKGRWPGDCDIDGLVGFQPVNAVSPAAALDNSATDPSTISCDAATPAEDQNTAFADLRAAKLAPTSTVNAQLASHMANGVFNIGYADDTTNGLQANVIVAYDVPAWMAKMMDVSTDGQEDGATGRIRRWDSGVNGGTWPTTALDESSVAVAYYYDKILP